MRRTQSVRSAVSATAGLLVIIRPTTELRWRVECHGCLHSNHGLINLWTQRMVSL